LQGEEEKARTAKAEKADRKNPKRRTQNNNINNNKNNSTRRRENITARSAEDSEETLLERKKPARKKRKKETSRKEEILRNLRNARAAARRNRKRLGISREEGGNLNVEIARLYLTPAVPKEGEQAEADLMEQEDNLRQGRKEKTVGEVTQ